jgi:hypothetical protein
MQISRRRLHFALTPLPNVQKTTSFDDFLRGDSWRHHSSSSEAMKTQYKIYRATGVFTVATLTILSSAVADPSLPPPPSVTVQVGVPDYYVWDGYEYVGVIGSQYYYLAPGDVWAPMPSERRERFEHWEHNHHDWQEHAIRNERYRHDMNGHEYPWHEREEHHEHHEHD